MLFTKIAVSLITLSVEIINSSHCFAPFEPYDLSLLRRFIGHLLRLLMCNNEKFGAQIQKHVKQLVGHELNCAIYGILFDQIKVFSEKFFDQSAQVAKAKWFNKKETLDPLLRHII